ncbi:serine/threonine-protein kinase PksC [Streptomyces inusitatus]|uniref:non-specific serine/threonine protein kinase n=1 Tax=Streptomyces inusitatus TaxID=68221 RepID=A0A918PPE3_9ACTN|nr:protein kinase [Streptomyces inusitatus]GGZ15859.1 serine/threonine-protein kinase PksC [Streptomyces inusitatus]
MSQDGGRGRYSGGSLAGGRYQLRDLLGEGGMAAVHLAYDTALDRQVAIKTLHTQLAHEQSFRERFRREAQAVAKLSHPNIVSVFDTGEDTVVFDASGAAATADGGAPMPYIVMEYVEGLPLGSVLHADVRRYGAMPADKALKVTADVLAALDSSHEVGLVHRDIKPGNVMMTGRGVVKVMDFGIARAMQSGVTSMTQTGMVVGTPQYLSPEQALGRGVDARSDLYSVGVMLFQLLTGRLPFDADAPLAIAYAHVQEEPPAPSSINRSVTPAMDALVARALRKNPNERFPSAAAMRDECARVASAGQSSAPVIVSGGPVASGAGVGSAVFPPVDHGRPPAAPQPPRPQPMGTPYQQSGPYRAPTPGPQYGYPQGPGTVPVAGPVPGPVPGQHGGGYPGPAYQQPQASYTMSPPPQPSGSPPRRKGWNKKAVIILGGLALVAAAIYQVAEGLRFDPPADEPTAGPTSSASAGPSGRGGSGNGSGGAALPPERNRTIKITKCTDATEDGTDPSKVQAPNLLHKDVLSVKECLRAAGWTWNVREVDNPQWPKDTVISQFPAQGAAVPPKNQEFELQISTGKSG